MNGRGLCVWMAFVAGGCGDFTESSGEFGRLSYGLHTDYESESGDLTEVSLITNHPVQLDVSLTEKGERDANEGIDSITHTTSEGEIVSDEGSLTLTVASPGELTVSSMLNGELFDQIGLHFERPEALDLVSWVRGPYAEEWSDTAGTAKLSVEEGGQISFLAIPLGLGGERIMGEFTPVVTVDPPQLAVPDATVVNVYEKDVLTSASPVTFFAVEPGLATFTITDAGNDVSVTLTVEISPIVL